MIGPSSRPEPRFIRPVQFFSFYRDQAMTMVVLRRWTPLTIRIVVWPDQRSPAPHSHPTAQIMNVIVAATADGSSLQRRHDHHNLRAWFMIIVATIMTGSPARWIDRIDPSMASVVVVLG
jgi:hypothetical protein